MAASLILLGIIGIIILGAITAVVIVIVQSQQKTARAVERNKEFIQRQQTAVWAGATIVSVRGGVITGSEAGVSRWAQYELSLRVTPPGGEPYLARTNWLVDVGQMSLFQPGQQLSVKIDQQDPQIIYPVSSEMKYVPA